MTIPADFYRAFEERFRGERSDVLGRLAVYRPFLDALVQSVPGATALDLGCGRGEWLEVLRDAGIPARGVDLDPAMLEACRAAGLDASEGDAVSALRDQADASVALVSAFHLVEHMPFEALHDLVRESLRALRPGGLLLIETPNPENIVVGSSTFYLDPTHVKPLPPPLLAFLPEYYGFEAVKIARVQEPEWIRESPSPVVLHVLRDVSPDYAVIARKGGNEAAGARFAPLFARDYGVTMELIAQRQEDWVAARFRMAHDQSGHAIHLAGQAQEAAASAQRNSDEARVVVAQVQRAMDEALARAAAASSVIAQMRASASWRLTAPLRALARLFQRTHAQGKE